MPATRPVLPLFVAVLLAAPALAAAAAEDAAAAPLSAADREAIAELVGTAIAHGYPDVAGGELVVGEVEVKTQRGERSWSSRSNDGLHVRLPDGDWLVGMQRHVVAGGNTSVTGDDLQAVPLADAAAALADHQQQDLGDLDQWIGGMVEMLPPAERAEFEAAKPLFPLFNATERGLWGLDPVAWIVHLHRLGHPEAWRAVGLLHVGRLGWGSRRQDFSQPRPLSLVQHRGHHHYYHHRMMVGDGMAVPGAPTDEDAPSPAIAALRQRLFDHFVARLARDDAPAEEERDPAAAVHAFMHEPSDYERRLVERLLARRELPAAPPEDADLLTRAAFWSPASGRERGMSWDDIPPDALAGMGAEQLAMLEEQLGPRGGGARTAFGPDDLDALVAVVGATGPSRWLDGGHPRTDGDCALRVVAHLLGFDPRVLVGRSLQAPWTDAERAATATALQAWWAAQEHTDPDSLRLVALPELDAATIVRLVDSLPKASSQRLLDALAERWVAGPPALDDPGQLAVLLKAAAGHEAIQQAVADWPLEGAYEDLLVAWHLQRGHREPFEERLDAWLEEAAEEPEPAVAQAETEVVREVTFVDAIAHLLGFEAAWDEVAVGLAEVDEAQHFFHEDTRAIDLLAMAAAAPQAGDLARLLAVAKGPAEAPQTRALIGALLSFGSYHTAVVQLLQDEGPDASKRLALPLALLVTLLHDERQAPAAMVAAIRDEYFWDHQGEELPDDLRVADLVAGGFGNATWHYMQLLQTGDQEADQQVYEFFGDYSFPITGDRAERDAVLQRLRVMLLKPLPASLEAAGLPPVQPGGGEQGGDAESLF